MALEVSKVEFHVLLVTLLGPSIGKEEVYCFVQHVVVLKGEIHSKIESILKERVHYEIFVISVYEMNRKL